MPARVNSASSAAGGASLSQTPSTAVAAGTSPAASSTIPSNGSGTSTGGANGPVVKNAARYKTELCRAFTEKGLCKYGDKCQVFLNKETCNVASMLIDRPFFPLLSLALASTVCARQRRGAEDPASSQVQDRVLPHVPQHRPLPVGQQQNKKQKQNKDNNKTKKTRTTSARSKQKHTSRIENKKKHLHFTTFS